MVDNKSFFDAHGHVHAYHKEPTFYRPVVSHLEKIRPPMKVLDLGCGDGSFIKNIIEEGIRGGDYLGVDISSSMLGEALELLRDDDVSLILADGFSLPLVNIPQFELIHLDSVLHHLIGRTRTGSQSLAKRMLNSLYERITENGFFLIEEMFYESYFFPSFTSRLIFYGLKFINYLKLDLGRISKHIIPGLEVNFYSQKELIDMLSKYGKVEVITKRNSRLSTLQRLFLQKEFGHLSLMVQKSSPTAAQEIL